MLRRALTLSLSAIALFGLAFGAYHAMHSSLFLVRVVEVADLPENSPLDAQSIEALASVPVDQVNLFDLNLDDIERRLMSNAWIRDVRLIKVFPQTLSISVSFKQARAILQSEGGKLSYVDSDGTVFGRLALHFIADLPVLSGFSLHKKSGAGILGAIKLLDHWDESTVSRTAQLSSVQWDEERGYRILVSYLTTSGPVRTWIDVGQEIDDQLITQFARLSQVIHYLASNSVATHQIWADTGKKIVVKTAHGS